MKPLSFLIPIGAAVLLLQACGGGGGSDGTSSFVPSYTGLTTEARIETANAEDLSTASVSGALQASIASDASSLSPRPAPSHEATLLELSPRIAQWVTAANETLAAREVPGLCDTGTATTDATDTDPVGTIVFVNCGIDDGSGNLMILNGTVDYAFNQSADTFDMTFHVTALYLGETAVINLTIHCVSISTVAASCAVSSDFVGLDGRIYRVADIDVTGNPSTGVTVTATVYDPDHGRVSLITGTAMVFDCPNGVPSTGSVTISGADTTSAMIDFVDCSQYIVTIGGSPTTYFWP